MENSQLQCHLIKCETWKPTFGFWHRNVMHVNKLGIINWGQSWRQKKKNSRRLESKTLCSDLSQRAPNVLIPSRLCCAELHCDENISGHIPGWLCTGPFSVDSSELMGSAALRFLCSCFIQTITGSSRFAAAAMSKISKHLKKSWSHTQIDARNTHGLLLTGPYSVIFTLGFVEERKSEKRRPWVVMQNVCVCVCSSVIWLGWQKWADKAVLAAVLWVCGAGGLQRRRQNITEAATPLLQLVL